MDAIGQQRTRQRVASIALHQHAVETEVKRIFAVNQSAFDRAKGVVDIDSHAVFSPANWPSGRATLASLTL